MSVAHEKFSVRIVPRLVLLAFSLCSAPLVAQTDLILVGSGSTVPANLYRRWSEEYNKRNSRFKIRYVSFGTGEGITDTAHGVSDFGAGEAQLADNDQRFAGLTELPVAIIGIVPIYNLPGVHHQLRVSGDILAEIFLGELKTWDVPEIRKLNPEIALPNLPIHVVNRRAGKGSNYVFTEFLAKASSRFRSNVGISTSPPWPVGEPAERSSDMVEKVMKSPGSIGYVEYRYAVKGNAPQAAVLNSAGRFVRASRETITAACMAVEQPQWDRFSASLSNASGVDSYPITSFTWVYVPTRSSDIVRAAALQDFLDWVYVEGQQFADQEGYAMLPPPLLASLRKRVKALVYMQTSTKQAPHSDFAH